VPTLTLGLGANLGDRLGSLQRAVDLLAERGVRVSESSRVWETAPVGGPQGQGPYLNAVVRARTDLDAHGTLLVARSVETTLGRTREVRWGPRTIDIDVLLVDDEILDDPELTVPHPRMRQRSFVILPLLELDPDPVLPGNVRLLDEPSSDGDAYPAYPPLRVP
jgi:2-amino-4-hydroxy-6-hydroxymethyldihydropteridine diphosphokinase